MRRIISLIFLLLLLCGPVASAQKTGYTPQTNEANQVYAYLQKSKFGQYTNLALGNPLTTLKQYADIPRRANVPQYIVSLAGVLIGLGFALSLWRAALAANEEAIKGAFANMIVTAALLSVCFNYANGTKTAWSFSAVMFNAWGTTYDWSRRTFAPDVDQKLVEAENGIAAMVSEVTASASLVAIPGGMGVGIKTVRGLALAAKGEQGLTAANAMNAARSAVQTATPTQKASLGAGAKVLSSLGVTASFIRYSLTAFSGVVTVTGILTLACIYVLPFGLAAINFGSTRVLWGVFGTFFACWLTILLLPMFMAVSLNMSFVEPARAMDYYSQELSVKRQQAQVTAQQVATTVNDKATQSIQDCQNAPANPAETITAEPCAAVKGGGWVENLLDGVGNVLTQKLGVISDLFNGIVNTFARTFWGISIAIVNVLISIGIMLATPGRFAALLGATAEQIQKR